MTMVAAVTIVRFRPVKNNYQKHLLILHSWISLNDWCWHKYVETKEFLAATKHLFEHFLLSVCLSVRLSHLLHYVPIIMIFSGVITNDRRYVHAKGQCQTSKVKVTEVMTPFSRFRIETPVWNHIWWWNGAQSFILLRRGALLFFKVIHQISKSHN